MCLAHFFLSHHLVCLYLPNFLGGRGGRQEKNIFFLRCFFNTNKGVVLSIHSGLRKSNKKVSGGEMNAPIQSLFF